MKYYLLTVLLLTVLGFSALGQSLNQEVYPQQASIEHNKAVQSFSSDYLSTFGIGSSWNSMNHLISGNGSTGIIGVNGSENVTLLSQLGYNITGVIDINGSGNHASVQQRGSNLLSMLSIVGNNNQFDMTQEGSDLQNYFKIYGSGSNFEAHQTNAGMNFKQSGSGSIPLSIQQRGRPSPIIIRNH